MGYIDRNPLIFLSGIWAALILFNVWGMSFILEVPYSNDVLRDALLNSAVVLSVLVLTYGVSYVIFSNSKQKAVCASLVFMGSPLTLMFGVIPNAAFLDIFFNNWVIIGAFCFIPHAFWPHFWRSLFHYKPKHAAEGRCVLLMILWIVVCFVFIFILNVIHPLFFLACVAGISILVTKLIVSNDGTDDSDFEVPFYIFMALLMIVQFFPMLPNLAGLSEASFRIEVDYEKSNGFLMILFMTIMLGTVFFRNLLKTKLKAQLYSFTIMGALVLSLMAFQAKKHSVATYLNSSHVQQTNSVLQE